MLFFRHCHVSFQGDGNHEIWIIYHIYWVSLIYCVIIVFHVVNVIFRIRILPCEMNNTFPDAFQANTETEVVIYGMFFGVQM